MSRVLRYLGLGVLVASVLSIVNLFPSPGAWADTATYTSTQVGTSGQTAQFTQTGSWQMAWSFNCSNYGSQGNFQVSINGSTGDIGPNELSTSESGTDYYTDTGVFSLSVNSECNWTITVSPYSPSAAVPTSPPMTITSNEIGDSGQSQQFTIGGPWAMAWSYNCSNYGSQGNFQVSINGSTGDIGPNELGPSGTGTDNYNDTGTFSVSVNSECHWSLTISLPHSTSPIVGMTSTPDGQGYWLVASDGSVYAYGDAADEGSMTGRSLAKPIVGMASTPDGKGYWLVASDGGIFAFGDAGFYGSTGNIRLAQPIVGMTPTPDGRGYYLVASDGGIFAFGDAVFQGSMGGKALDKPVVGMALDQATGGYWLVAADGGIFSFNAPFYGSTGNIHLAKPIVGMEAPPDGSGYRFVASDGGVFCFNEPFNGSMGGQYLAQPVTGMAPEGVSGYWLVARDGGIFAFGGAPFYGSSA